jgi:hypothetical protein
MTARIIAIIIILSLIGGGVIWLTSIIIKAERAATIERATELIRDTDKRLNVARKATDADLCRMLGGASNEQGECE